MRTDPIVEEVRQIRHQIERQCQEDPEEFYKYLIACQKKLVGRLVCRRPKPLVTVEQTKTG